MPMGAVVAPSGTVTRIELALTIVRLLVLALPKPTPVASERFAPVSVTTVPTGPELGVNDVTVATALRITTVATAIEPSARPPVGLLSPTRSEEHTSELQSRRDLVCRLLLEKKKNI